MSTKHIGCEVRCSKREMTILTHDWEPVMSDLELPEEQGIRNKMRGIFNGQVTKRTQRVTGTVEPGVEDGCVLV